MTAPHTPGTTTTGILGLLDRAGVPPKAHIVDRLWLALERLGELHAAGLDREDIRGSVVLADLADARRERDDARRQLVLMWVSEFGGRSDVLTFAAKQWGRQVALELFPDEVLAQVFRDSCGDDDEVTDEIARARAALDKGFPS